MVLFRNGEQGLEFLLFHRISGAFTGNWAPVGGALEEGESTRQAAIRESLEEAGVELEERQLRFIRKTSASTDRVIDGKTIWYIYPFQVFAVSADGLKPSNTATGEHDEMKWITLTEASSMQDQGLISNTTLETFTMIQARIQGLQQSSHL